MEPTHLRVFVYGTLKRGQSNHDPFCRGVLSIEEATVRGRLYELPYGFPGLRAHEREVYAVGTPDYLSDAGKQHRPFPGSRASSRTMGTVHGQLMTFDDPDKRLAALDALEGYVPGEKGLYERVLISAEAADAIFLAWAYRIERATGVYLPGGRWPAS